VDLLGGILEIRSLSVGYLTSSGVLIAVNDADLAIGGGEAICIVGESGSGKTTLANTVLRILPPSSIIISGEIIFEDVDLLKIEESYMSRIRGSRIGIIPQNPSTSLNPIMKIEDQVCEFLKHKKGVKDKERCRDLALGAMKKAGIADPERVLKLYPHQLSGGMKQRVLIAMAISTSPSLLIADEPTSMLDATIQAQILDLLRDIKHREKISMMLITHDLGVASQICDYIYIMYRGEIVEKGPAMRVLEKPLHPYTISLMENAFLGFKSTGLKGRMIQERHGLSDRAPGCLYSSRCPYAFEKCFRERPGLLSRGGDHIRCFLYSI
jgi:peptide/nickel transport system ATP-binding protein/oligopeptide transport system ATP-binding protein